MSRARPAALSAGVFLIAIYGGYFGAAAGVMALALMLVATGDTLARSNALKNVVLGIANAVAAVAFALFGDVDWLAVLPLAAGLLAGGRLGPVVVRHSNATLLRGVIGRRRARARGQARRRRLRLTLQPRVYGAHVMAKSRTRFERRPAGALDGLVRDGDGVLLLGLEDLPHTAFVCSRTPASSCCACPRRPRRSRSSTTAAPRSCSPTPTRGRC